jgi:hypothetical protein
VEFGRYCAECGAKCLLTAPYSPQQNGMVKRQNQSVVAMAQCMLKAKKLPSYFWGEAMSTAVYLLNRALTRTLDHKTPFEVWHGDQPAVHHLRVFGSITHVKIVNPNLKKLDDWSVKEIFIGNKLGSKTYHCYNPVDRRIIISPDVVFEEAAQWDWGNIDGELGAQDEPFIVEYTTETFRDTIPCSPSPSASLASTPHVGGAVPAEEGMGRTMKIWMQTTTTHHCGSAP